jgi:hypothetical protein
MLMLVGKLLCGLWLIRFSVTLPNSRLLRPLRTMPYLRIPHLWGRHANNADWGAEQKEKSSSTTAPRSPASTATKVDGVNNTDAIAPASECCEEASRPRSARQSDTVTPHVALATKPVSLYPAAILGLAMVARGEIGFLVSSLAESNGIFTANGNDQVFLIVTWAIVLCTVIGPVGVGLLVRRVRRLEKEKGGGVGGRDVLGVWGVA